MFGGIDFVLGRGSLMSQLGMALWHNAPSV
jgi:hypothetical protein